jgi:hypothetical protein
MRDPQTANFIQWWPLYRLDDTVHVQNQILFMDALPGPLLPHDPYVHVAERRTVSEDGSPISEWRVPVADVEHFLTHVARDWP